MKRSSMSLLSTLVFAALLAPAAHAGKELIKDTYPYPQPTTRMSGPEVKAKMKELGCLKCHSSKLLPTDATETIGLGNNFNDDIADTKWFQTVFGNPAIAMTAFIFQNIDPSTNAERRPPDPRIAAGLDQLQAPPRVPPWWRYRNKHASFYIASGRGNRLTHKMIAQTVDFAATVQERVDEGMDRTQAIASVYREAQEPYIHIRNYILKVPKPVYRDYVPGTPTKSTLFTVDTDKARRGRTVFDSHCKSCHAPDGGGSYLVTQDHRGLGTDPALCTTPGNRKVDSEWFNASPFNTVLGGIATPVDTACAYMAPPLDGIWAAAPYLHNGSVPTLRQLLKSDTRLETWIYTTVAGNGHPKGRQYNHADVGWQVEAPPDKPKAEYIKYIYDTSKSGYSNAGHTYGDELNTGTDRDDLIEYLKTL